GHPWIAESEITPTSVRCLPDAQLLALVKTYMNDPASRSQPALSAAWMHFQCTYEPLVASVVRRVCKGSQADIDEIIQGVWADLPRTLPKLSYIPVSPLRCLIKKVVYRKASRHAQHLARYGSIPRLSEEAAANLVDPGQRPEALSAARDLVTRVHRAL